MKPVVRFCRICRARLSRVNPSDICFCHPQHPEYNPIRHTVPLSVGTDLMNHIAYADDADGPTALWGNAVASQEGP